jgi:hypothetical protein
MTTHPQNPRTRSAVKKPEADHPPMPAVSGFNSHTAVSDGDLLRIHSERLDSAAWTLFDDYKRLDRIVELAEATGSYPIPLLNHLCIRLRGLVKRTEEAMERLENSKSKHLEAAE